MQFNDCLDAEVKERVAQMPLNARGFRKWKSCTAINQVKV